MAIGQYLGLIGAVIGGIIGTYTPVGTAGGAAIGGAIGAAAGAYFFPEGPKMKNVPPPEPGEGRSQVSSYGAMIPMIWGSKRIAGNIIYMSEILETLTTSNHRMNGTRYYEKAKIYTATFAVAFCEGPVTTISRMWMNNEIFVDFRDSNDPHYPPTDGAITTANQAKSAELRGIYYTAHYGALDQAADATLIEILGVANVQAYRGLFYVVFKNFPLGKFGALPAVEVEAVRTRVANTTDERVSNVLSDICEKVGMVPSTTLDVADLVDEPVVGYALTRQMPARTAIEPLMSAFLFDVAEIDWKLHFVKRGEASMAIIEYDELGVNEYSSTKSERMIETRAQDVELPTHLILNYESIGRDYDTVSQHASRIDRARFSLLTVSLGIVMTETQAKQTVEILLKALWNARKKFVFFTTQKYLYLSPARVITVAGKDMRVVSMTDKSGIIEFVCESEDSGSYVSTATADNLSYNAADMLRYQKIPNVLFMEIPIMIPGDYSVGFYVAFYGTASLYGGGGMRMSEDQILWIDSALAGENSNIVGECDTILPSGMAGDLDYTNTLDVDFSICAAVPVDHVFADGLNVAAIGNAANGWEIIQFENVDLVSGTVYRISGLIRGFFGTENKIASHVSGEYFVLLSGMTSIDRIYLINAMLNIPLYYQPVSMSRYGSETSLQYSCPATCLEQIAPTCIEFGRTASVIAISWKRNDCQFFTIDDLSDSGDIPMSEAVESYEIDIKNSGGTVLRTLISSTTSVNYTDAATDFPGGIVGSLNVSIYQISAQMGRGFAGNKAF